MTIVTADARPSPGMSRTLYLGLSAVFVIALAGGLVSSWSGYRATAGPAGAVKGYFAALRRGDAASALAFGDVPAGPHTLLTSTVLKAQRQIAPISGVTVLSTVTHGPQATVTVRYRLGFASGDQQATDRVAVVHRGGAWHLVRVAVRTTLHLNGAGQRAGILGAAIPSQPVLLFPGAIPVSFDSAYLTVDQSTDSVQLDSGTVTDVQPAVSDTGRTAITAALAAAINSCLRAAVHPDPRCPLPSDRMVPGTVRGALVVGALDRLTLTVQPNPVGVISVSGTNVRATARYRELDFNNQSVIRTGTVVLPIRATVYAVAPVRVLWSALA